jgi:hypothetical protein
MNNALVPKSLWQQMLQGFEITDIAIRDVQTLQLLSRKAVTADEGSHLLDHQIPTRIYSVFLSDPPDTSIECQELLGMTYPKLGVSRVPFVRPGGLVASMNRDGDVWPLGGGNGPAEEIAPGQHPGTNRLKCLWGHTYSIASCREMYKRVAVGQWERIEGLPVPTDETALAGTGFRDLDAFSESDMYAVGGHGDVWHFDGSAWRQMGFPTNEQLATVTCAGDGNVYITSEGGSLWVGQKSTWKLLEQRGSSVLWNDVQWFNGQLWLCSDYMLRVWDGKAIVTPEHEGKPVVMSGHMDAYDGILAVADLWTVSVFDGQQWRNVVAPYKD